MKLCRHPGQLGIDFMACFVLPAYTVLFAGRRTWFGTNFSVSAVTGKGHYRGFLLWGLLSIGYFVWAVLGIAPFLPGRWPRLAVRSLILEAGMCLMYAVVIPYLPQSFPRAAILHVGLAALACVLLMAALLVALITLELARPGRFLYLLWVWAGIAAGSAALFLIARMISSALEIFFTISAALLTRKLWIRCRA